MKLMKKLNLEILCLAFLNILSGVVFFYSKIELTLGVIYFLISFVLTNIVLLSFKKKQQGYDQSLKETELFLSGLGGTSEQIFNSCFQINQSAIEQSNAVVQTSSASNEISAMIKKNTGNVNDVNETVNTINDIVKLSSNSSSKLEENMQENARANEKVIELLSGTSSMLEELTVLFSEVVDKTAVINDIVFQTKLLSFNASVEAARAGEHGKGFSVVAEEIGNLASMSGESASSIQSTLEMTGNKVTKIIKDINDGSLDLTKLLQNQNVIGEKIFSEFNTNFERAMDKIVGIVGQIDQIKTASIEQGKGVDEMREGIELVNESIQRNSLVVGQTTNLANLLGKEVETFKTKINEYKHNFYIQEELDLEEIPWESKYEIGVKVIDEEHKNLLSKINLLIRAMNLDIPSRISSSFNELKDVTIEHFSHEEAYMENIGYKSINSHKKVHKNLLEVVVRFGEDIESNSLDKSKLSSFLKNWLFTHIMGVDVQYTKEENLLSKRFKESA